MAIDLNLIKQLVNEGSAVNLVMLLPQCIPSIALTTRYDGNSGGVRFL
jgi:hypothetical protein